MPGHIFGRLDSATTEEQFKTKYNDFFQDYFIRNREKVDDFSLYFLNFCFNYYINNCFLNFKEDIVEFTKSDGVPFLFTFETNEQLMGQNESEQQFQELLSENSFLGIFELEEIKNLIKIKILPVIGTKLNLIQGPIKRKFLDFAKALSNNKQLSDNSLVVKYKEFFNTRFATLKNYLKTNLANNFLSFSTLFVEYAAMCFEKRNLLLANLRTHFEIVANHYLENFNPQVINRNIAQDLLQVMEEINKLIQQFCEENSEFINEKMKIFKEDLDLIDKSLKFEDDEEYIR
ncbi:hypothetical protein [Spiroplasma sp. DGKH1]|uniref:hypothetical protein n=1 Tax=Spiroplasma sp. DGKH1 TaxID=3050074 RepID=UPI0034C6563F